MSKKSQDIISEHLGVEPRKLNSSLTSAQNRVRLYWANFEIESPPDSGIELDSVLDYLDVAGRFSLYGKHLNGGTIVGRRLGPDGKRKDLDLSIPITQCLEVRSVNRNKSNCLTTVAKDTILTPLPIGRHPGAFKNNLPFRNYTTPERLRLMNLPVNYCDMISENQALKATGNGWDAGMITHIFKELKPFLASKK